MVTLHPLLNVVKFINTSFTISGIQLLLTYKITHFPFGIFIVFMLKCLTHKEFILI